MRKAVIVVVLLAVAAGAYLFFTRANGTATQSNSPAAAGGRGPGGAAFGRPPMTVELATVTRAPVSEEIVVVGNLIGAATVEVVPKASGRLQTVNVRIGDQVRRGQLIALVEDQEIRQQVKQAEASFEVARATIRQREADLQFAETNLDRSRNLYGRQLLPRQTLDDAEARHQAAAAQLDLARAQFDQASARLEELRINLSNTRIVSPVDGFVGKRNLDPGGYASANTPIASLVDIRYVRMVVNLVERDIRRIEPGIPANVEVDAYPGETFRGRVARVAPVLNPQTRTAEMEIEVPNPDFRLKPGMYARVGLTVDQRTDALVVPRNALVDIDGRRGVFTLQEGSRQVEFQPVEVGLQNQEQAEVRSGLNLGQEVVTTGAAALRTGDTVLLPGEQPRPPGATPGQGTAGSRRPGGQGAVDGRTAGQQGPRS
jgi:RND family efflux transporter MFP subunit